MNVCNVYANTRGGLFNGGPIRLSRAIGANCVTLGRPVNGSQVVYRAIPGRQ